MSIGVGNLIGRVADRRVLQRWTRLADAAGSLGFSELKSARTRAGELRRQIDRLCGAADGRMSGNAATGGAIKAPPAADWAWRPEAWRVPARPPGMAGVLSGARFGSELALFHDCKVSELTLRQIPNRGATDHSGFGLRMDVFRFDGSFLSLALDLPQAASAGLSARHLLGLSARFEMERPLEIFARLNIRHGPNTEQLVREIPASTGEVIVEFDLAYAEVNERRIEKAWLDLIFEGPEMNQVVIRDLTMHRRPRAEI